MICGTVGGWIDNGRMKGRIGRKSQGTKEERL